MGSRTSFMNPFCSSDSCSLSSWFWVSTRLMVVQSFCMVSKICLRLCLLPQELGHLLQLQQPLLPLVVRVTEALSVLLLGLELPDYPVPSAGGQPLLVAAAPPWRALLGVPGAWPFGYSVQPSSFPVLIPNSCYAPSPLSMCAPALTSTASSAATWHSLLSDFQHTSLSPFVVVQLTPSPAPGVLPAMPAPPWPAVTAV